MSKLVAILNLTPDSFSDGQLWKTSAIEKQIQQAIDQGANVIDIGAESTRPGATALSSTQEWQRLAPHLKAIIEQCHAQHVQVSLDSYHPDTIEKALHLNIDIINDVSGFSQKDMVKLATQYPQVQTIIMHQLGIPADKNNILPQDNSEIAHIVQWLQQRCNSLKNAGLKQSQLIIDPGIGFGKNAQQSLNIIKHIDRFLCLGLPVMVGHSRKSCFASFTSQPAEQRDIETIAASLYLAHKKIDYLRVHNIKQHQRALSVFQHLTR